MRLCVFLSTCRLNSGQCGQLTKLRHTDSRFSFLRMAACVIPIPCKTIVCKGVPTPKHDRISVALFMLGHPSSGNRYNNYTGTMYHSEDVVVSHSITCSPDPFLRAVAARKLAVVGRQCEKNNKNRARTLGKDTLEHI